MPKIQWAIFATRRKNPVDHLKKKGNAFSSVGNSQGVVEKRRLLGASWTVFGPLSGFFGRILVVKRPPRGFQDASKRPRRLPRRPEEALRVPRAPQDTSKTPQDAPESTPRGRDRLPRRSQEALCKDFSGDAGRRSCAALALKRRSGDALATLWLLATLCPRSSYALSMLQRLTKLWQRSGHALTLERRSYTLPRALKLLSL